MSVPEAESDIFFVPCHFVPCLSIEAVTLDASKEHARIKPGSHCELNVIIMMSVIVLMRLTNDISPSLISRLTTQAKKTSVNRVALSTMIVVDRGHYAIETDTKLLICIVSHRVKVCWKENIVDTHHVCMHYTCGLF